MLSRINQAENRRTHEEIENRQEAWIRSGPGKPNQRKASSWTFPRAFRNKSSRCESCLFSQGKIPEFTKMGEIHELFVLALFLVWFAGATPDWKGPKWPKTGDNWREDGRTFRNIPFGSTVSVLPFLLVCVNCLFVCFFERFIIRKKEKRQFAQNCTKMCKTKLDWSWNSRILGKNLSRRWPFFPEGPLL